MSLIKRKPPNNPLRKFFISYFPIAKFFIHGDSMQPTFHKGESVLVNRFAYLFRQPKIFDIVACTDPRDGKILIKRITKIKDKKFFIEGDNKFHTTDSNEFGMIEQTAIVGKVITNI